MKCVLSAIVLLFPFAFGLTSDYVFDFGIDQGEVIYVKDGNIPLFQPLTTVDIPLSDSYSITYVKVTVNSLSPPKVEYDNLYRKVTIKYSWAQISQSTYNIVVKAVVLRQ